MLFPFILIDNKQNQVASIIQYNELGRYADKFGVNKYLIKYVISVYLP